MVSHTTPTGMINDEAMRSGCRVRKLLLANVAVKVAKTCGPPTTAVMPRLMASDVAPSQTASSTSGTMTTLATSRITSNVALFSQGIAADCPASIELLKGEGCSCSCHVETLCI